MMESKNMRNRAVVIGGSIAGMVSARVLAEHFTLVTILKRINYLSSLMPVKAYRHLFSPMSYLPKGTGYWKNFSLVLALN